MSYAFYLFLDKNRLQNISALLEYLALKLEKRRASVWTLDRWGRAGKETCTPYKPCGDNSVRKVKTEEIRAPQSQLLQAQRDGQPFAA